MSSFSRQYFFVLFAATAAIFLIAGSRTAHADKNVPATTSIRVDAEPIATGTKTPHHDHHHDDEDVATIEPITIMKKPVLNTAKPTKTTTNDMAVPSETLTSASADHDDDTHYYHHPSSFDYHPLGDAFGDFGDLASLFAPAPQFHHQHRDHHHSHDDAKMPDLGSMMEAAMQVFGDNEDETDDSTTGAAATDIAADILSGVLQDLLMPAPAAQGSTRRGNGTPPFLRMLQGLTTPQTRQYGKA